MQTITSKIVANKLTACLYGELTLSDLVDWAENIMIESDFEESHFEILRKDCKPFGRG